MTMKILNFVAQIGHLPKGINPPSVNKLHFGGPYMALALRVGIITGILALTVSENELLSTANILIPQRKKGRNESRRLVN